MPRLLDVYCGIGGASAGYVAAGFDVVGIDLVAQPDYPYEFLRADALEVLSDERFVRGFDVIHASPPCQAHSAPNKGNQAHRAELWPELIAPTRVLLTTLRVPWVIENVAGAPVRKDLRLCGEMWGLAVLMHRFFEFGSCQIPTQPVHKEHRGRVRGWRHGEYFDGPYIACYGKGGGKASVEEMREAKGINWSFDHFGLRECLPPVYTRYIGAYLIAQLLARAA